MKKYQNFFLIIAVIFFAGCASVPCSQENITQERRDEHEIAYIRYIKTHTVTNALDKDYCECKVATFVNPQTNKRVTLIGMIHFADRSFYENVKTIAEKHDRILTEGVNGENKILDIPFFYVMKLSERTLGGAGLYYQTSAWDDSDDDKYINADINSRELFGAKEQIFSWVALPFLFAFGEIGYVGLSSAEFLSTLFFCRRTYSEMIRENLATSISSVEASSQETGFLDDKILCYRNDNLLRVLDEELQSENVQTVAMPWGAAHMVGLEKGLRDRGFVNESTSYWIPAFVTNSYSMTPPQDAKQRFRMPYLLCWENARNFSSINIVSGAIVFEKNEVYSRQSLAWGLLGSSYKQGENIGWFLPLTIVNRPLIYGRIKNGARTRHRFLFFFEL